MVPGRIGVAVLLVNLVLGSVLVAQEGVKPEPSSTVNFAGAREPLNIQKFANETSVIVVAEVKRVLDSPGEYIREQTTAQAKLYAAEIEVREVLKGSVQPGKLIVGGLMPTTPSHRTHSAPLQANTVRVFFLSRERDYWRIADPFYGVLIAAPVTPRPSTGTATEKVMEQLLAALKSDLVSAEEKRDLVSELRGSSDERIAPTLRSVLESSHDDALTATILGSLIERNDPTALTRAGEMIQSSNSRYVGLLILSMARLERPELLPDIALGLRSPVQSVRIAAANSLAESKLPQADALVLPLLDDPNRQLVAQVMVALATKYKQPEWAPDWTDDKRWDEKRQHWQQFLQNATSSKGR